MSCRHLALMSNALQSQNKSSPLTIALQKSQPLTSAGLSTHAADGSEQGGWRSKPEAVHSQYVVRASKEGCVKSWERGDCSGCPQEGRIGPSWLLWGCFWGNTSHWALDLVPHTLFSEGVQHCQPESHHFWRRRLL